VRLGVLDVGSNTVHLLVVDAYPGARPQPAVKTKVELRLSELLDADGAIDETGADRLVAFCGRAKEVAEQKGAASMLAFATSAIRDARNGEAVLARVHEETGVDLQVLSGEDEARLTFLAVRRWYGWSSRRLLVLDIGGGSFEAASGIDEDPDVAVSLPLGAGRLTRAWLRGHPADLEEVRALRRHIRVTMASVLGQLRRVGEPDHVVGTSKTFRSLARIAGAAPSSEGPYVQRTLRRADLESVTRTLIGTSADERARLPGVGAGRAEQLLAGALVAEAALDLLEADEVEICPWALREGILLREIDQLAAPGRG
jgi:exopolyphosphatase/guanosine-5'-triphosphate,3'-diphosphate pyrophosphatase